MKRKVDWDEEEESFYEDANANENEESDKEEPRVKDVLEGLSQLVSRQKASDLLHSMAASKDILFWTPRGQLLRNQRIIPLTNIPELVEYVLLPHNDDIVKPRALKTFIDGLAELRINKRLIQNKRILAELFGKKNKPIAIKTVRLVRKKWSSKAVSMKMTQRLPLNIVNIKSQKTQIWNLKEIQTFHILKKPQVQRFCLKEKVFAAIAAERTFTKEQLSNALDVSGMIVIGFVRSVHIKFLLIVNT